MKNLLSFLLALLFSKLLEFVENRMHPLVRLFTIRERSSLCYHRRSAMQKVNFMIQNLSDLKKSRYGAYEVWNELKHEVKLAPLSTFKCRLKCK